MHAYTYNSPHNVWGHNSLSCAGAKKKRKRKCSILFLFFLQKDVFSHVCSLLSLRPLSTCVAITLSVNHKHTQLLSLHHNVSAAADKPEVIRVVVLP